MRGTRTLLIMWLGLAVFAALVGRCESGQINPALLSNPGGAADGSGTVLFDACRDGAYAVTSPPFGACSGFRPCEPGHYCTAGIRRPCPAGTFGSSGGLRNSSCSGLCRAGYYCPLASVSATAMKCHEDLARLYETAAGVIPITTNGEVGTANTGNTTVAPLGSVYCPEGSARSLAVPAGYYSVTEGRDGNDDIIVGGSSHEQQQQHRGLRANINICPKGWYCPGPGSGMRHKCPGGTYGSTAGLSEASCTAVCPAGYFCPFGSVDFKSRPCGSDAAWYCPAGSERKQPTEAGFYASGHISADTVTNLAAVLETAGVGGFSESVVCPAGTFCLDGIKYPCPPGRYGATKQSILPECSGMCTEGWYCPRGSASPKQFICGTDGSVYCPAGSSAPVPVSPGYYTHSMFASSVTSGAANSPGVGEDHLGLRHTAQTICSEGFYCLRDGTRYPCPAGRYGSRQGITSPVCSGVCDPGYYCPEASTSSRQQKCGSANVFCPQGSSSPKPVAVGYYSSHGEGSFGDYNGPADVRSQERKCEPGFYCDRGVKRLCRPGHYGSSWLATSRDCDGPCDEGHYCPEGSISRTEVMCGAPNNYCPTNSSRPLSVDDGFYAVGGIDDSRRVRQLVAPKGTYAIAGLLYVCPAGFYGQSEGLKKATCTGPCNEKGWYCPAGSISPFMRDCGSDNFYCPASTPAPIKVHSGYYTADYEYEPCPPGQWRANATHWVDPTSPGPSGVVTMNLDPHCEFCPAGRYKSVAGDGKWLCKACPPHASSSADSALCDCHEIVSPGYFQHFDAPTGTCLTLPEADRASLTASQWERDISRTRSTETECEPGHYCVDGQRYRCPVGHYGALRRETRPTCQGLCAAGYYCQRSSVSPFSQPCGAAGNICPEGSAVPLVVPVGWYSNEDANEQLRTRKYPCSKGMFCPGDGRQHKCPAGRYADVEGSVDSDCSGVCERGYYCEEGSPDPQQYPCGSASVYCPRGSAAPTPVTQGYYGAFSGPDALAQRLWDTGNSTCSVELLCEPGYYCKKGMKFPCPPGTFGWRFGDTTQECGGKCAAGYYCPSFMSPQPDAPPHTQWPRAPHVIATPFECGGVSFLCPRGSFYPVLVGGGNYTVGGSSTNSTRTGQEICLAGTYCSDGIVNLCPKGRFGSSPGQSVPTCTGWCPPGYYCPAGTSSPVRCPEGYYASGAAWACSACPGTRKTPLQCQDSRECCFRGA